VRDALGEVQSALVLGGGSEIARAICLRLARGRCETVVLAGRPGPAMDASAEALRAAGVAVEVVEWDAGRPDTHVAVLDEAFDRVGDIDLVVAAAGVLGDQAAFEADPASAAEAVAVNLGGMASSCLAATARLRRQGHGALVVITSVAGVRARRDNFVYGSTKAGLDAFAQGLGDSLVGTGVRVVVVRPGFVRSRMTEGMEPAPFATTPEAVAEAVVAALATGREVVWVPRVLAAVFGVFRLLPRRLWRIVSARR
jgi:decaprenylphospho-beta-D-erythro-pentofuranosid-2-ulose 2-reductase